MKKDGYIIRSLLDADFYKFTMGQAVFRRFCDVKVKYTFKNRTKGVSLAEIINEEDLRCELDHVRQLCFTNSELHYLRGTNEYGERMFREDYLEFLKNLELPSYKLEFKGRDLILEFEGAWSTAIYWETFALAIVNELYTRSLVDKLSSFEKDKLRADGISRLAEKIRILKENPGIVITDFGTRRRFSRDWQDYVVKVLVEELQPDQFRGTSNVFLAMKHGLLPMGTSAHEMYMVMSGIMHESDEQILKSHNKVLEIWWEDYGKGLSVALTDTYGTDFFFRDMTAEQAHNWKGLRQDSGDPFEFGEKAIKFYERHGINPVEKMIIFSDGLDIGMIVGLYKRFAGRIKISFGWGTNLTNDLGVKPLSIVIKVAEANGHGTVKLSDNLAKAMGDSDDIERFRKIFGYTSVLNEACKY